MSQRRSGFAVLWAALLCVALVSRAGGRRIRPLRMPRRVNRLRHQDETPAPQEPTPPPADPATAPSAEPAPDSPSPTGTQDPPAQDPAAPDTASQPRLADEAVTGQTPPPAVDPAQARAEYEARFLEWKEMLKQLRTLKHEYQLADEPKRGEMEEQWKSEFDKTAAFLPTLVTAAINAYRAAPNEDRELANFLMKVLDDDIKSDKYDQAAQIADVLLEGKSDLPPILPSGRYRPLRPQQHRQGAQRLRQGGKNELTQRRRDAIAG